VDDKIGLKADEIVLNFNNTAEYNNNHIAIAESSETGKTQFALHLLREFPKNQITTLILSIWISKD